MTNKPNSVFVTFRSFLSNPCQFAFYANRMYFIEVFHFIELSRLKLIDSLSDYIYFMRLHMYCFIFGIIIIANISNRIKNDYNKYCGTIMKCLGKLDENRFDLP